MSSKNRALKLAAQRRKKFRKLVAENETFPLATITYHGPSPDLPSQITVGILASKNEDPIIRSWIGENIAENVEAAQEISLFIKEHQVARVLTSEWVMSCPHEEGVDYPLGETCPHCPDWQKD